MRRPLRLIALTLLCRAARFVHGNAAEIHVLCSNGFKAVMEDLVPQFERATANVVRVTYGLSAELSRRIQGGEPFDLAILTPELIDGLAREGRVAADSRTTLARSPIALAMKQGAARPDLGTEDSLRRTLLAATSIAYAREGASASHFLAVLQQLGLSETLKSRIVPLASGAAVGDAVSRGEAELGVLPVSEIMPIAGIEIAGAFPDGLAGFITIAAATGARALEPAASKAFIAFLADPSTAAGARQRGAWSAPVEGPRPGFENLAPCGSMHRFCAGAGSGEWRLHETQPTHPVNDRGRPRRARRRAPNRRECPDCTAATRVPASGHHVDAREPARAGLEHRLAEAAIPAASPSLRSRGRVLHERRSLYRLCRRHQAARVHEGVGDSLSEERRDARRGGHQRQPAARRVRRDEGTVGERRECTVPSGLAMVGGIQRLDNERATIWEFVPPASRTHRHLRDAVAVSFTGATPAVSFIAKDTVHDTDAPGRPDRVYIFELK